MNKYYDGYGLTVCTDTGWICGVKDDEDTPLAIIVEVMDTREFDDKPDNDYPFVFSMAIVNANPSKKEINRSAACGCGDGKSTMAKIPAILASYGYRGGVPIDYEFLRTADVNNFDWKSSLSCNDAKIVHQGEQKYGTLAANGIKEFHYPQFRDDAKAFEFAEILINKYANVLMRIMIGFILDRPINMIGDTGWKTITEAGE